MRIRTLILLAACAALAAAAERRSIFPPGVKPVGPYSPGVIAGDYLFVSGQGARNAEGKFGATPEDNVRQTIANVKSIVEAAGLTMNHIVYAQVYLHSSTPQAAMEKVWKETFPSQPPKRLLFATHRMPTETPVEINAIAVRDLANRQKASAMLLPGETDDLGCKKGPGFILCSARATGAATVDEQTKLVMERLSADLKKAGFSLANAVAANVQMDTIDDFAKMNAVYGSYFPKDAPPTRTTIAPKAPVASRDAANGKYPSLVRVSLLAVQ